MREKDQYRPQALAGATIGAGEGMFTSEPIPGRPSAFSTSDGRYYANAEDARRAQKELDAAAAARRPQLAIVPRDLSAPDARRTTPRPPARLVLVAGGQRR